MPGKGKERNNDLRSKESSFENTGSGAEKKNNGRFRSSRMDEDEEDEAEAERRAIE